MSTRYVELIEEFLESELAVGFDEDVFSACGNLSIDQLKFFSHQLHEVDSAQHQEMLQTEPRGIVSKRESTPRKGWTFDEDIRPVSAMFTHPYNNLTPIAIEHLKRQLLFFSRVAIVSPELPYERDAAEMQRNFVEFLRVFIELKPLIEDRSVVLLPRAGFYSNEIEGGAALVRTACTDDPAILEWISSHRSVIDDFAVSARRGDPYFDAGIRICSAIAYGHTLAATHPFVGHLNKILLSDQTRVNRERIAATQNIDKIDLPGLGGLNWKDVVAVRRNEDSLRKWRAELAAAISSVDPNLAPSEFVDRFDSQVQAQLNRSALELDKDVKQSSAMSRFKRGATGLAISAIAATATVALGGPMAIWGAITEVAKKDGAKEALRFFWESREASAKRALRSHYAVFTSNNQ